jgi:hypothetical protein
MPSLECMDRLRDVAGYSQHRQAVDFRGITPIGIPGVHPKRRLRRHIRRSAVA